MPYLLLGVGVLTGLYFLAWGLSGGNARAGLRLIRWTLLAAGAGGLLFLMMTGRFRLAAYIALGMLPLMMRLRAFRNFAKGMRGPSPGQSSDVETRYLRMRLDHDSGELHGTVLEGRFQGRLLQELAVAEVISLLQECRIHDSQSAGILETYLDRVHGAEWRAGAGAHADARSGGPMTVAEAFEILDLEPGASPDDIREAHRHLMLKMHPDHGGSTYLAAKINQAKDLLLTL